MHSSDQKEYLIVAVKILIAIQTGELKDINE